MRFGKNFFLFQNNNFFSKKIMEFFPFEILLVTNTIYQQLKILQL